MQLSQLLLVFIVGGNGQPKRDANAVR
jgi:hypothetical protein